MRSILKSFYTLLVFFVLFTNAFSAPVHADNSDCVGSSSQTISVICADDALLKLNKRLKQLLEISEQISFDRARLTSVQNQWLIELNSCEVNRDCIRHLLIDRLNQVWKSELSNEFGLTNRIIDNAYQKYGTAYSGGGHGLRLDNVGATIDLYRALIDLPHYNFTNDLNDYDPWDFDLHKIELNSLLMNASMNKSVLDVQPLLSAEEKYEISVAYDLAIPMGDGLDWWLAERQNLSNDEWALKSLAGSDDSIEWMIASMSASYLPWALDWHLPYSASPEFEKSRRNVIDHATSKFTVDNQIHWLAIASMFMIASDEELGLIEQHFNAAISNVLGGSINQLDYLVANILGYELARLKGHDFFIENQFIFSDALNAYLIERFYKLHLFEYLAGDGLSIRKNQIMDLAITTDDPFYLSKIAVALGYTSADFSEFSSNLSFVLKKAKNNTKANSNTDFEQLIDAKIFRLMNVFSIDELTKVLFSKELNHENNRIIGHVLLNRSFVLNDFEAFDGALEALHLYLSDEQRGWIDYIKKANHSAPVEAALIIFKLKQKSLWLTGGNYAPDVWARNEHFYKSGTDLNDNFLSGDFLTRDVNAYLMLPQAWDASWSMCCLNIIARLARASNRGWFDNIGFDYLEPIIGYERFGGLLNSIDDRKSIITEFHPNTGLAFKLSKTIIDWHNKDGSRWYWKSRHHILISEMLASVVRLQKRNATAKLDKKYLGQVAFDILQRSYADTTAAAETKYWFKCERNCR